MRTRFIQFWEGLKANFWFTPLLIILGAILASFGFIYLDHILGYQEPYEKYDPSNFFLYFYLGSAESARSILSTISGAMLGVAGTVFSITLVALTLASSQFGPRLLRNFMHDRLNQVVLGTYIATFIYCLLVLRTVKSSDYITFVPHLSILFAIIVTIVNIFLLIIFIHHISMSINADQVVSKVGTNLNANIKRLFSEELGEEKPAWMSEKPEEFKKAYAHEHTVLNNKSGYLQVIDSSTLLSTAVQHDLLLELNCRPGEFLVNRKPLLRYYAKEKQEEGINTKLCNAFIMGNKRTPSQDAEFAIHQMVEIAARALSPGINDPYTAITCIDKLTATLSYLTRAKFPSPYRYDEGDQLRIILNPITFTGMIDAAFHQIRQYGQDNESVMIHLMESLVTINDHARTQKQKEAVHRHAEMVYRAGEQAFAEPNDIKDLKRRYDMILRKEE
jgi:uncharacterized membrane protein